MNGRLLVCIALIVLCVCCATVAVVWRLDGLAREWMDWKYEMT